MPETITLKKETRLQTPSEELLNAITHGAGALLSIAGLVILVTLSAKQGDPWEIAGFSIYGFTLVLLYTMSTLYHSFRAPAVKRVFNYLDHSSIYLLIAGTYTPLTLTALRGPWGWSLFGVIWAMAIGGIVLKIFTLGKKSIFSVVLYIIMGWTAVVIVKPLIQMLTLEALLWIVAGGIFYTAGTIFYSLKRILYTHTIWHLFVLLGSLCHFFCMLSLVKQ